MSSKSVRLLLLGLSLLGGCQKDINHHPVNIAVTSIVSLSSGGAPGNGASTSPSVTPDGRYVAFASFASNLTADNTRSHQQVFRRDLVTGETILISIDAGGLAGDGDSDFPSISGDGKRIAFRSIATNLSANANINFPDIYVRDLGAVTPATILASDAFGGLPNDGSSTGCFSPSISQSGDYVAFVSDASNLIDPPLAITPAPHAFRRQIDGGITEMVDIQPNGLPSDNFLMLGVSISSNGRFVAFDSAASDLGNPDAIGNSWVYIRDMTVTITSVELASPSLDPSTLTISTSSFSPSISADGRVVAFLSTVPNLVPDDSNGTITDVFVRDLQNPLSPRMLLVSRNSSGIVGSLDSGAPTIAADGRSVAFSSNAINLADGDFNGLADVFWHDLQSGKTIRVSVNTAQQEAIGTAISTVAITSDGRCVVFSDHASNLVTNDVNGLDDVFVRGPLY